jgi:rhamnosyl/mannosyltransferase
VIFVGRLVEYKGLNILLDAINRIDAQLVVIGDGPLRDSLQRQSHILGISNRVFFLGRLPRHGIKAFLHAAQLLVLPSITIAEAYGLVQMEAMATGCPVVNTNLPTAVPHIARHNREGLTVSPGDPLALAQACKAILDDPQLRSRLSNAARARAFTEYSADIFRSRMKSVYDEVTVARAHRQIHPRMVG